MKYLQIYPDEIKALTERLDDAERGRLFMAMIAYAETGEELELPGNENFVWPQARLHLDKQREAYSEKVAGAERAREAREQAKKEEQKEKFCSQKKNSDSRNSNSDSRKKTLESREEQEQEQEQEQEHKTLSPPPTPSTTTPVDKDLVEVVAAWEKASARYVTAAEADDLKDALSEHGKADVLEAIKVCVRNRAVKLAYFRKVLANLHNEQRNKNGPFVPASLCDEEWKEEWKRQLEKIEAEMYRI